ncbi:hypothetical protein F4804DRAFT_323893 [Jackrogersella minutella]|nr:hypothetical protein F4804DRAFT_323893 [Jackrogersella minutella]
MSERNGAATPFINPQQNMQQHMHQGLNDDTYNFNYNVYHKLATIDVNRGCPMELIHITAKAAMRDPLINHDIDQLYHRCFGLPPIAYGSQQIQMPAAPSHVIPTPPLIGSHPQPYPQALLPTPRVPVAEPAADTSMATHMRPDAARTSSVELAPRQLPVQQTWSRDRPAHSPRGDKRRRRSSTLDPMIKCSSSDGREYEVALSSIKDPEVIPQCPRPPKSAAQLGVSKVQSAPSIRPRAGYEEISHHPEVDDDEPEPREKLVDYSKLIATTEKDLGWYGKYDKMSDQREQTAGINVSIKIEGLLRKLCGFMDKHQSFNNRVHVLTVMREIIMAVLQTQGSRVGSEVRKSAYQYDDNMVWAMEKLTPGQRRKLKNHNGGAWVRDLRQLIDEANQYCFLERLPETLRLIEPNPGDSVEVDSSSDVEILPGRP